MLKEKPIHQRSCCIEKVKSPVETLFNRFLVDNFQTTEAFCEQHGKYEAFLNTGTGEISTCPECEKEVEQQKQAQKHIEAIISRVDGVSKKYRNAGFRNFKITEKNRAAFSRVLKFAKEPKNTWLLLLGENGTGKTHLAHAVLKLTGGIYREFDDIALEILDAQNGHGNGQVAIINKYSYTPMLVVDEVDKVKNTEGRITWLNDILRKRYNELLPVILCGNIDLKTLYNRIELNGGRALRNRIEEVGEVVLCDWESFRPKLREAEAI